MPGVAAGEDRRVVRERDRRHAGDRAPLVRRAHLDEAGDVRRLARGRERVEHVGVRAVEQEADHVARAAVAVVSSSTSVRASPSWPARYVPSAQRRDAEELGDRGRDVDEAGRARHQAVVAHALARDHERRARLHHAERPVLAPVAALVLPVVRGGVDDAQVGCGGMVEELGGLLEREGIGVVAPARGAGRRARRRARRAEPVTGRRTGRRPRLSTVSKPSGPCGGRRPGRRRWPPRTASSAGALEHHVDDRRELRVEQDVERLLPDGRSRGQGTGGRRQRRFRGPDCSVCRPAD